VDALTTGEYLLPTDEEIEGIGDFLEGKSIPPPPTEYVKTNQVLIIGHGVKGTLLGRHLVYMRTVIHGQPA